ncbi:Beta-glucanase 2 [Phlyctema vagabunda]|uniref:Beta-glucanase 2 n=1 Tax=Phlyctema vagabunda TaxID=108571 RepID=A0ABR4PJ47_9HELO
MLTLRNRTRLLLTLLALCLGGLVVGDCECGYSSTIGTSSTQYVFTDLLESDFLHIQNVSLDTDWRPQDFNVTAKFSRGTYGTNFSVANIVSNPILNATSFANPGERGGAAGLQLFVRSGVPETGYVGCAEIDSSRADMLWGSYRAAMRLTLVPGTVGAFFWYFNDSQEIDMEFLSEQWVVENNTFPVQLVLQSAASVAAGYNALDTGNYVVANLPFNPTDGYHEYRIDFIPGNVIFYADGSMLAHINTTAVPTMPGHLILTQWSNGNPLWSYGPPTEDAIMTVSYVKAYFNSSLEARQTDWARRCQNEEEPNAICPIPDQTSAPDVNRPADSPVTLPYFFSDEKNKTNNQTVYDKNGGCGNRGGAWLIPVAVFIAVSSTLISNLL